MISDKPALLGSLYLFSFFHEGNRLVDFLDVLISNLLSSLRQRGFVELLLPLPYFLCGHYGVHSRCRVMTDEGQSFPYMIMIHTYKISYIPNISNQEQVFIWYSNSLLNRLRFDSIRFPKQLQSFKSVHHLAVYSKDGGLKSTTVQL